MKLLTEDERREAIHTLVSVDNGREIFSSFYKDRPVEFIEDFCISYDPRRRVHRKQFPFILFPKQREFVLWLFERYSEGEDGLVEKSRDMGATRCGCSFSVFLWLLHDGVSVGWGSRKGDELVRQRMGLRQSDD